MQDYVEEKVKDVQQDINYDIQAITRIADKKIYKNIKNKVKSREETKESFNPKQQNNRQIYTIKTLNNTPKHLEYTSCKSKQDEKAIIESIKKSNKYIDNLKNKVVDSKKSIKKAAKTNDKIIKATIATSKKLVDAIIAGGWVSVIIVVVLCFVAGISASIYGVFFSNEKNGTGITMQTVVNELNSEYQQKIENEKAKYSYDILDMSGSQAVWNEVLAIYSVKTNTDENNPQEIATLDESKKKIIHDIFYDMNTFESELETIVEAETEKKILHIIVTGKTADDMAEKYNFSDKQKAYLDELLDDKNIQMWNSLIYGLGSMSSVDISSLTFENETANDMQKKVVSVATNSEKYGIVSNAGYCQKWVADVYQVAVENRGCAISAIAAAKMWSVSSDWSKIQVGATVYGYSSNQYGHVGIYIGNGMVAHNLSGDIKVESLQNWITSYNGFSWGWENGTSLI